MKRTFLLLLTVLSLLNICYGQDKIIERNGKTHECEITSIDSSRINFIVKYNKTNINTHIKLTEISSYEWNNKYTYISDIDSTLSRDEPSQHTQDLRQNQNSSNDIGSSTNSKATQWDIASVGFGLGFDYGGIGTNLTIYPQKNIGLFAGFGYAIIDLGYNVGIKLRAVSNNNFNKPVLYGVAMYGYNTVIKVSNANQLNKMFYGPTLGFGVDFPGKRNKNGYVSIAVLIPIRNAEVDEYIDELKQSNGVTFSKDLLPVGISIGYKRIIHRP